MKYKANILVAPLNWGLGHATRCIPIINKLLEHNFNPILASDGEALELLQKEFPTLQYELLPSYNISYPSNGKLLKYKFLLNGPTIIKAIKAEFDLVEQLIKKHKLRGIISDNRYGIRNKNIPSIIICHQLNVLSGKTSGLSSLLNKILLNKFERCWIPDSYENNNLSGILSRTSLKIPQDYIGLLSRFNKTNQVETIDVLIIISGPPPHREFFANQMISLFQNSKEQIVLVKGLIESEVRSETVNGILVYNYLGWRELEIMINQSKMVLCRSGYSSIMDLAKLEKKAFFIPTPGQYEQVYLAKRMEKLGMAPYCNQTDFTLSQLHKVENFTGPKNPENKTDFKKLFGLFERK